MEIYKCNQCKEHKTARHYKIVNDHLNDNHRMRVCKVCVDKNRVLLAKAMQVQVVEKCQHCA